jgi:hypothetical protein
MVAVYQCFEQPVAGRIGPVDADDFIVAALTGPLYASKRAEPITILSPEPGIHWDNHLASH